MTQIGAIFWAQWRTLYHFYPRRGVAWSAVVGLIWYGLWAAAAFAFLRVFSNPNDVPIIRVALPGGLLLMFLYWQVVPLMLATILKGLILRYGGLRVYRAALPFFLGLILGEFVVGGLWQLVGALLNTNTYAFWD